MIKFLRLILILLVATPSFAQSVITGVVKDSDGGTAIGANVQIKDTQVATVTDANGQFRINAPQQLPVTIRVTLVGYETQEIEVFEADEALEITLVLDNVLSEVVVTSRRREESLQEVPIPISVISGKFIQQTGAFNVNRLKELIPSVQLYSSNPRNTGINIRGIGSPF